MSIHTTRTYATLLVSHKAFDEILKKLKDAGYDDQIHQEDDGIKIDMHGIALVKVESLPEG